jgi:glycerol uptake facilitator-like aquaporin
MFGKQKIATLVAEFLGTGVLTLLILSVQRSTIGVPFFVAMAAGLTFALMVFALGRVSGGYFNPAIAIAMWTARKLDTLSTVLFVAVQVLGAWGAYALYTYFTRNGLQPIGGKFDAHILAAESVGTFIFAFGVAAAYYQGLTRAVTAAYSGIALMLGGIAASSAALGLLNPAVAHGVRAWVWGTYVLGPVIGAVIGVNLYALLFADTAAVAATSSAATATRATATKKPVAKKKTTSRKKK